MREKGFILNSTPSNLVLFFWISFFEIRDSNFPLKREGKEFILNSTPLESCYVFVFFWALRSERRECILNSTPPRILLYILCLFLDFILRNQRSEILNIHFPLRKERRECILNSTPFESCFVFWVSFFETREVRLFSKGSLRAIPPRSLLGFQGAESS